MAHISAHTLRPEDEISHYRIVGPLGAGGMGEVYLAQDRSLERNVAIKVLPPDLVRSEERVRRFVQEARSASSLSHPNIITIYEIGQGPVRTPGQPDSNPVHFISMELVSGKTLTHHIHDQNTDLRTLLGWLAQAADGLAKAHAAGIVHRDLKPGNIMVTNDGFAKVLDFGLAKLTETRASDPEVSSAQTRVADATAEGVVVGTAGYMSPEQIHGRAVDHRSDIFSFGCILYEAATRKRPFAAETAVETMHRILNEKPIPVEELNPKAPAELRRLIRRCLAKSPDQRLQSMKDLAIELREIYDEYDALSASASSGSMATGAFTALPRRRPVLPWVAAALVALGVIAAGWWALGRREPAPPAFQSTRTSVETNRGDVLSSVLSADGRYLAYIAGRAGRASLRVRQVATGSDVEVMPPGEFPAQFPSFSPDGNYLYYAASKPGNLRYRALFQVPSLGGTAREKAFDVDSRVSCSPDGRQGVFRRAFVSADTSHLVVVDLETGRERVLATVHAGEGFDGDPAWSPDGRRIASIIMLPAPNLRSTIATFDAGSGKRQDLLSLDRTLLSSLAWLGDGSGIVSSGIDLKSSLMQQLWLHSYPAGRTSRLTNDFNDYTSVSVSAGDEAVAAVRTTRVGNAWLAEPGQPLRRLTSAANPENSVFFASPVDTGFIVYSSPAGQVLQVWAVSTSGGPVRQLTTGTTLNANPRGRAGVIIFDRLDSTGTHVWRMDRDGGGARQLTNGAGEQCVAMSEDGRHIAVNHYDSPLKFTVLSTDDGRVVRVLEGRTGLIGFSPDGRSVLAARPEQDARGLTTAAWEVLPIEGGEPSGRFRLPETATETRWMRDGLSVSFRDRGDAHWNVRAVAIAGGTPRPLTRFTEGRVTAHDWSPDGRRLAVRLQVGETSNLWVTEADGSRPVQLTAFTSESVFSFGWLPDSRRLLVTAGIVASDAVLVRDFR
jgi:Tol biopolymer transport system component